ncbi:MULTISPECIES: SCO family protein [unclassified Phaeobacter]|uniref:SCO family protein n=1 Tax=unclassified Phaeobacter TaxID=2621772 RepID=UPI003A88479C
MRKTTLAVSITAAAALLTGVVALADTWRPSDLLARLTPAALRTATTPFSDIFPSDPAFQFSPPEPGSYRLNRLKPAPDGAVLTTNGIQTRLHQLFDEKITLVSFVYLTCGDVDGCPLAFSTLYDIHDASAQLPGLRQKVQLMTISFDPERDTVEAIAAFAHPVSSDPASAQKLDWHILTTADAEALRPLLDGFGQVIDRGSSDDQINHLLRMYLVDTQGMIRNVYGLGLIDPRLLMTDVETLLMAEAAE